MKGRAAAPAPRRDARLAGPTGPSDDLKVLAGTDLDLAVAHGAAYYGLVRRGKGVRIRGGTARAYYIGIESAMPAVPGMRAAAQGAVRRAVRHGGGHRGRARRRRSSAWSSASRPSSASSARRRARRTASATSSRTGRDDIEELAPVETTLAGRRRRTPATLVPVQLAAHVTEVGTLELWCVARDGGKRWKLEFNVRAKRTSVPRY